MYMLYLTNCSENDIPKSKQAKEWLYRKIFNEDFNLSFHPLYNDTCDDCDHLMIQEKDCGSVEERDETIKQKVIHLDEANLRYNIKRDDKKLAKERLGKENVLTVDM
ncbi:hypothetical protein NQ314_006706 [Rhamnusium bicolor]|uniref:Uncharacterized protein n=1 Tax=Rhamnusium bicolor TaxID=1586634 RepID=A0AAV8YZP6_9CUCU|nr:hypothetical protein NQ314_006706 [Rhamnusium bicolor]